jgi:hypothetical protein
MDKITSISQQLLRFSPDVLIVVDFQGVILFANATSRELFGYSREQIVGRSIEMLVPDRFRLRRGDSGYDRAARYQRRLGGCARGSGPRQYGEDPVPRGGACRNACADCQCHHTEYQCDNEAAPIKPVVADVRYPLIQLASPVLGVSQKRDSIHRYSVPN